MPVTLCPFDPVNDPTGEALDSEATWVPSLCGARPTLLALVGPAGENLINDPLHHRRAVDFILDCGDFYEAISHGY